MDEVWDDSADQSADSEGMMTGTIHTLRVDKGFGFIKDDAGKEYFFHQSAVQGEESTTSGRVTRLNSRWARAPKGHVPRA